MESELQQESVWLILLYSILTLGLYQAIWIMHRAHTFNRLKSKEKLSHGLVVANFGIAVVNLIFSLLVLFVGSESLGSVMGIIESTLSWVGVVTLIILAFKIRNILMDHFKREVSILLTLLFPVIWLQAEINHFLDGKKSKKA